MRVIEGVVVVVMPEPRVVRRAGVAVAGAGVAALLGDVDGCSGAAALTTCVAANAEMPVKVVSVTAVASTRSAKDVPMSGGSLLGRGVRVGMPLDDQTRRGRA